MSKKNIAISVDEDLHKKAQEMGFNLSGEFEAALRKRIVSVKTDIPKEDGEKCSACGRSYPRQTADDVRNGTCTRTLVWLCPEEVWICESCLNFYKRKVTKVAQ